MEKPIAFFLDCTKLEYYQNTGWKINHAGKELTCKKSSENLRSNLPLGEIFTEQRSTANYYTPYKFSGKEKDEETSYSYFGARYYMSDVSIWLSVDPMRDKYPNMSPYMYCAGNPVVLKDPDGKVIKPTNEAAESQLNGCLMSFVGGKGEKVYDVFHITTTGYGTTDATLRTKSEFIKNAKRNGVKLEGENADNAYNFYVAMQSSETTEIETLYGETESSTISAGEGGTKVITANKDQQKYISNNTNEIFNKIHDYIKDNKGINDSDLKNLFSKDIGADKKGNSWMFFKSGSYNQDINSPEFKLKGTIMIYGTNKSDADILKSITDAINNTVN